MMDLEHSSGCCDLHSARISVLLVTPSRHSDSIPMQNSIRNVICITIAYACYQNLLANVYAELLSIGVSLA